MALYSQLTRNTVVRILLVAAVPLIVGLLTLACGRATQQESTTPEPPKSSREDALAELQGYCDALTGGDNPYLGTELRSRLTEVAERPHPTDPALLAELALLLSAEHLQAGDPSSGIRLLREALAVQPDPVGDAASSLLWALSVAYLKLGEQANCTSEEGRYTCILPVDGRTSHLDRAGSEAALETLRLLLDIRPTDSAAKWLVNVAHMTLGSYPGGVPAPLLADLSTQPPDGAVGAVGRFEEVAPAAGIYDLTLAGGAVIEDFDGDGLLDVVASSWHPCVGVRLYLNGGDGRFTDATDSSGLSGQLGGLNLVQADYDNDGWVDLLVLRGGWLISDGEMRVSLLRNEGGLFMDVTHAAGLAEPARPGQVGVWGDYDRDGHLDLFLCKEPSTYDIDADGQVVWGPSHSQLFRNRGDGTFEDVARQAGVTNGRYCKGAAWGDFDGDGLADLYVSNYEQPNRLYRAAGDGTFVDVGPELGVDGPLNSFAAWWWDYDNDGDLDIYVAGFDEDIRVYASRFFGGSYGERARPRLYSNNGMGGFDDVTAETGLDVPVLVMGANFGDLDGDGFPDMLLGTGSIDFEAITTNVALLNDGGERFKDVSFGAGLGHLQKGHGVAFGDLDRDGDQDVYVQTGGFYPGDAFSDSLYRNPGHGNRWLTVTLQGTRSARSAIGARIAVTVEMEDGGARVIHSLVGSGGSFGGSSLQQEIGLGGSIGIARLSVRWPATGQVEDFVGVPLDSHIRIVEGQREFEVLDRPPVPLGGRRSSP